MSFAATDVMKPDISRWWNVSAAAQEKKESLLWASHVLPSIPRSVARVEDAWRGPGAQGSAAAVILVQDAHTNFSCQMNEAQLLGLILADPAKSDVRVYTEAGKGDLGLSYLKNYKTESGREGIARTYVQKGLLHGAEYLQITSGKNFILRGVEDPALYVKTLRVYRDTAGQRQRFARYLDKISALLDVLKPALLNPFLLDFDRRIRDAADAPEKRIGILLGEARRLGMSLHAYPHLEKLAGLKNREKEIDFDLVQKEEALCLSRMPAAQRTEILKAASSSDEAVRRGYIAYLQDHLTGGDYPELKKYIGYWNVFQSLSLEEALAEEEVLQKDVYKALVTDPSEEKILSIEELLASVRKLFNFSLSSSGYSRYKEIKKNLVSVTGFLNEKLMGLGEGYDKALFLEPGFDESLAKAEQFYELTYARDRKFVAGILKDRGGRAGTSVLITGGFHTENLKRLLKEKNIAYISVVPQIVQETNTRRYEEILFSQLSRRNQETVAHPAPAGAAMTGYLEEAVEHPGSPLGASVPALSLVAELTGKEAGRFRRAAARMASQNPADESAAADTAPKKAAVSNRDFIKAGSIIAVATAVFLVFFQNMPFIIFRPLSMLTGHVAASAIQKEDSPRKYIYRYLLAFTGGLALTPLVQHYVFELKHALVALHTFYWEKTYRDLFLWSHLATVPLFSVMSIKDMKPMPWRQWFRAYGDLVLDKTVAYYIRGGFLLKNVIYWTPLAAYNYYLAASIGQVHSVLVVFGMIYALSLAFYSVKDSLHSDSQPFISRLFMNYSHWLPTAITAGVFVYAATTLNLPLITHSAAILMTTAAAYGMVQVIFRVNEKIFGYFGVMPAQRAAARALTETAAPAGARMAAMPGEAKSEFKAVYSTAEESVEQLNREISRAALDASLGEPFMVPGHGYGSDIIFIGHLQEMNGKFILREMRAAYGILTRGDIQAYDLEEAYLHLASAWHVLASFHQDYQPLTQAQHDTKNLLLWVARYYGRRALYSPTGRFDVLMSVFEDFEKIKSAVSGDVRLPQGFEDREDFARFMEIQEGNLLALPFRMDPRTAFSGQMRGAVKEWGGEMAELAEALEIFEVSVREIRGTVFDSELSRIDSYMRRYFGKKARILELIGLAGRDIDRIYGILDPERARRRKIAEWVQSSSAIPFNAWEQYAGSLNTSSAQFVSGGITDTNMMRLSSQDPLLFLVHEFLRLDVYLRGAPRSIKGYRFPGKWQEMLPAGSDTETFGFETSYLNSLLTHFRLLRASIISRGRFSPALDARARHELLREHESIPGKLNALIDTLQEIKDESAANSLEDWPVRGARLAAANPYGVDLTSRGFDELDKLFDGRIREAIGRKMDWRAPFGQKPKILFVGPGLGLALWDLKNEYGGRIELYSINKEEGLLNDEAWLWKKIKHNHNEEAATRFMEEAAANHAVADAEQNFGRLDEMQFDLIITGQAVTPHLNIARFFPQLKKHLVVGGEYFSTLPLNFERKYGFAPERFNEVETEGVHEYDLRPLVYRSEVYHGQYGLHVRNIFPRDTGEALFGSGNAAARLPQWIRSLMAGWRRPASWYYAIKVEGAVAYYRKFHNESRALAVFRSLGPDAVSPLLAHLSDPDAEIRSLAAKGLGELKDPRAIKPLMNLILDTDPMVRTASRRALGNLRPADSTEFNSQFADIYWNALESSGNPYIRLDAARGLNALMGITAESMRPLFDALTEQDEPLVGLVLENLGAVTASASLPQERKIAVYLDGLDSANSRVRLRSVEAISSLDRSSFLLFSQKFLPLYISIFKDKRLSSLTPKEAEAWLTAYLCEPVDEYLAAAKAGQETIDLSDSTRLENMVPVRNRMELARQFGQSDKNTEISIRAIDDVLNKINSFLTRRVYDRHSIEINVEITDYFQDMIEARKIRRELQRKLARIRGSAAVAHQPEGLRADLVDQALKEGRIPADQLPATVQKFFRMLNDHHLENIVLIGGGAWNVFFGIDPGDYDVSVKKDLTPDELDRYFWTTAPVRPDVVRYARHELSLLAAALGKKTEDFELPGGHPEHPAFDDGSGLKEVQYAGPIESRDAAGHSVLIKRVLVDGMSRQVISSNTGASWLRIALGPDETDSRYVKVYFLDYGEKDLNPLTDLKKGWIRIVGDDNNFTFGDVLRALRLKYTRGGVLATEAGKAVSKSQWHKIVRPMLRAYHRQGGLPVAMRGMRDKIIREIPDIGRSRAMKDLHEIGIIGGESGEPRDSGARMAVAGESILGIPESVHRAEEFIDRADFNEPFAGIEAERDAVAAFVDSLKRDPILPEIRIEIAPGTTISLEEYRQAIMERASVVALHRAYFYALARTVIEIHESYLDDSPDRRRWETLHYGHSVESRLIRCRQMLALEKEFFDSKNIPVDRRGRYIALLLMEALSRFNVNLSASQALPTGQVDVVRRLLDEGAIDREIVRYLRILKENEPPQRAKNEFMYYLMPVRTLFGELNSDQQEAIVREVTDFERYEHRRNFESGANLWALRLNYLRLRKLQSFKPVAGLSRAGRIAARHKLLPTRIIRAYEKIHDYLLAQGLLPRLLNYDLSAADVSTALFLTDADTLNFTDAVPFNPDSDPKDLRFEKYRETYFTDKSAQGYSNGDLFQLIGSAKAVLWWELEAVGADNISFRQLEPGKFEVSFDWAYSAGSARRRKLTYTEKRFDSDEEFVRHAENLAPGAYLRKADLARVGLIGVNADIVLCFERNRVLAGYHQISFADILGEGFDGVYAQDVGAGYADLRIGSLFIKNSPAASAAASAPIYKKGDRVRDTDSGQMAVIADVYEDGRIRLEGSSGTISARLFALRYEKTDSGARMAQFFSPHSKNNLSDYLWTAAVAINLANAVLGGIFAEDGQLASVHLFSVQLEIDLMRTILSTLSYPAGVMLVPILENRMHKIREHAREHVEAVESIVSPERRSQAARYTELVLTALKNAQQAFDEFMAFLPSDTRLARPGARMPGADRVITAAKAGNIVVLNNEPSLQMRALPVVRASALSRGMRYEASRRLAEWLDYRRVPVTHDADIQHYTALLNQKNAGPDLSKIYFVWSSGGIEGYADLGSAGRNFSAMETAPWNRDEAGPWRELKGVGEELRVFAIQQLRRDFGGDTVYAPQNINHILTLGFRKTGRDLFDYATISKEAVLRVLRDQRDKRNRLIRQYGYENQAVLGARMAMEYPLKEELERILRHPVDDTGTHYFSVSAYEFLFSSDASGKLDGVAVGRPDQSRIYAFRISGESRFAEIMPHPSALDPDEVQVTTYEDNHRQTVADQWFVGRINFGYRLKVLFEDGKRYTKTTLLDEWSDWNASGARLPGSLRAEDINFIEDLMKQSALQASRDIILPYRETPFEPDLKENKTFVTEADHRAQAYIVHQLIKEMTGRLPNISFRIVAEEAADE